MKFKNLKNFEQYNYTCLPNISLLNQEEENEKKFNIQNAQKFLEVNGQIKFPKNQGKTSIVSFGDWSHTKAGTETKNLLKDYLPKIDALVFLGDQGYDLYQEEGKVGNKFLKYAKSITSNIPYQVNVIIYF